MSKLKKNTPSTKVKNTQLHYKKSSRSIGLIMTDYYHRKVPACCALKSKAVVAGSREGVMANIEGLFPLLQRFLKELHP